MKFYLDTASVKEIQEAASLGLLDGVTTNPSLVAKEGRVFREVLVEICNIVDGPVSAEVVSIEADAMVKEGRELAKIHKNIVVKVPLIAEGLKATKRLTAEGIRVNVTLCFSPTQALLAAKAGLGASRLSSGGSTTSVRTGWSSSARSSRSIRITTSRRMCWSRACGIPSMSSKRRWPEDTSARCPLPSSSRW